MIGIGLAALMLWGAPSLPPNVQAFKKAFDGQKRRYDPFDEIDPSISKALQILLVATRKGQSLEPFEKAVAKGGETPLDYGSINGRLDEFGKFTFATVRMGPVSRTEAFDRKGSLKLPEEFSWNCPWDPDPQLLPSGLIFVHEEATMNGTNVWVRFVWIRKQERRFVTVDDVKTSRNLDQPSPVIKGNRITLVTLDEFESFGVSGSPPIPERISTWDCSWPKPRVVKTILHNQPLRFVDHLVFIALKTRKPTSFQRLIKKLIGPDSVYDRTSMMVDEYEEKTLPDGSVRVILNDYLAFRLKRSTTGYRLISVSKVKG